MAEFSEECDVTEEPDSSDPLELSKENICTLNDTLGQLDKFGVNVQQTLMTLGTRFSLFTIPP